MMHSVFLCSFVPICIPIPFYILCDTQGCPGIFFFFIIKYTDTLSQNMYSLFQISFWHCISWLICYKTKVILVNIGRISGQEYAPFSIPWYIWLSKLNLNGRHLPPSSKVTSLGWIKSCLMFLKRGCCSREMLRGKESITEFTLPFSICIHLIE